MFPDWQICSPNSYKVCESIIRDIKENSCIYTYQSFSQELGKVASYG